MRRITLKYARPGMVLELPVYDNYGKLLLAQHMQLDENYIRKMGESGVTELYIRDYRVVDVMVAPLFSPQAEGALATAFRRLVRENIGKPYIEPTHINYVRVALNRLIGDMTLNLVGDINVSCSISMRDFIYLQPVKAAGLAVALAYKLGMSQEEMSIVGMAALLKDIGMPPELISSVDPIAEGGSARMIAHPLTAYKLLSEDKLTAGDIAEAVLQHHEFWNGQGYPQGLKGEQISRYARIVTLADDFIELLAVRPGRGKYMPHETIEYIMANGGDQFDPDMVELFVRQVPSYPSGLTVQLNTGEVGVVSDPKRGFVARPIVRVCLVPGRAVREPYDIDLSTAEYQKSLVIKVLEYD